MNGHIQDEIQKREPKTSFAQRTLIFRNNGDGSFVELGKKVGKPFSDPMVGRGAAWGDVENNGKLWLLLTGNTGPARLLKNVTKTDNHWLTLRLIGVKSNRDGIGATVLVRSGGTTRRTMVRSGSSYLSQSDLRPHFGLGSSTKVDVEVQWPSGAVSLLRDVAADHIWILREGSVNLEK